MKKLFSSVGFVAVLVVVFLGILTANNLYISEQVSKELKAVKAEATEKARQVAALERGLKPQTIFEYIMDRNPKLSSREAADIITTTYILADEYRIDPNRIFAMADVESTFHPEAIGSVGERGLIQVTPEVWGLYREKFGYSDSDFLDWHCTLRVGVAHFRELLNQHDGDWDLAVAAYNAGQQLGWRDKAARHVQKVNIANRGIRKLVRP